MLKRKVFTIEGSKISEAEVCKRHAVRHTNVQVRQHLCFFYHVDRAIRNIVCLYLRFLLRKEWVSNELSDFEKAYFDFFFSSNVICGDLDFCY